MTGAFIYFLFYGFWIIGIRLIAMSLVTYFSIAPSTHFQDINEIFGSQEITLMAFSAFFFVGLQFWLIPKPSLPDGSILTFKGLFRKENFEKGFGPGLIQGALIASLIVFLFLILGAYRYLGYFVQIDEVPIEIANILLRIFSLCVLVYMEEFIFRRKLIQLIQNKIPGWALPYIVSLFYMVIKWLQFDLQKMQLLTLFLVSLILTYRHDSKEGSKQPYFFAGVWAGILVFFHPIVSLPVFGSHLLGNDFSGILILKPLSLDYNQNLFIQGLTGGIEGPLASMLFQLILILYILKGIIKGTNRLW